jgi:hypothetical protein
MATSRSLCVVALAVTVGCGKADSKKEKAQSPLGSDTSPAGGARSYSCDQIVPPPVNQKFLADYKLDEVYSTHDEDIAAKCVFEQVRAKKKLIASSLLIEVFCSSQDSDADIKSQLDTTYKVLGDAYQDVNPPLGRGAWTRKTGDRVVFWDPETGCKVDVMWEEGQPTLELARAIEGALR